MLARPEPERSPMSHDIEQHTPAPSPTRRTVLTGAAWSVPVIAAASLAPFAAASGTPVLAFNQASYSGTACGTITGASVSVTTNGTATSNVSVTTTLSGGYTFAGGSASYTGVSDGSGTVALPAINVPSVGGSSTLSAVSSGATPQSATASAPKTAASGAYYYDDNGAQGGLQNKVPAGTTPVGIFSFLAPNGDLYLNNRRVATNVIAATAQRYDDATWHNTVTYTTATGAYYYDDNGAVYVLQDKVPAGTTPVGIFTFLAPNGDLYLNNRRVATNVIAATAQRYDDATWHNTATYTTATGAYYYDDNGAVYVLQDKVPTGTTPVGIFTFLAPNGDLYLNNRKAATNVIAATAQRYDDATWHNTATYTTAPAC